MKNWKKEYEEIKVPENMKERMEASIERAKMEKRKVKKIKLWKTCASAAAVLAIVLDSSQYEPDSSGSHAADSASGKSVQNHNRKRISGG